MVIWLRTGILFSRWQRLVRCLTLITIGFPANHSGVIIIPVTILLRLLAKPVHFTIRKSAKVRYACERFKFNIRIIQLQPVHGLDEFDKYDTI